MPQDKTVPTPGPNQGEDPTSESTASALKPSLGGDSAWARAMVASARHQRGWGLGEAHNGGASAPQKPRPETIVAWVALV